MFVFAKESECYDTIFFTYILILSLYIKLCKCISGTNFATATNVPPPKPAPPSFPNSPVAAMSPAKVLPTAATSIVPPIQPIQPIQPMTSSAIGKKYYLIHIKYIFLNNLRNEMFCILINCYLYLIFFITDLLDLDLSEGILRKKDCTGSTVLQLAKCFLLMSKIV